MAKQTIKIADLAQLGADVDVSETQSIHVRALTLKEMVALFVESQEVFLPLFEMGLSNPTPEQLAPFLLSAPNMVARIIALASDEPDQSETIEAKMPATVQLIALFEVWKASVPDPKKAKELLSEVTALLRKLEKDGKEAQQTSSQTNLLQPLTS